MRLHTPLTELSVAQLEKYQNYTVQVSALTRVVKIVRVIFSLPLTLLLVKFLKTWFCSGSFTCKDSRLSCLQNADS